MDLHSSTTWRKRGTTAVRYFMAAAVAAATALFAYQTPAQAQSGATEPDPGRRCRPLPCRPRRWT
ncbi:hypothetical protein GCM10029992_01950 [Glycomyces albus]